MSMRQLLSSCLAVILIWQLMNPVGAATIQDKQAELENVQQQLYNKEVEREEACQHVVSATDRLVAAQTQLSSAQNELAVVEGEREDLENQIEVNQSAIDKRQNELNGRVRTYKTRLRDIYINGQINYLDVLLGAKDFSDFSSRMFLLKKIIASDVALIDDLKAKKAALEESRAALEQNLTDLKTVHAEVAARRELVAQRTAERESAYNDAVAEKGRLDEEYNELMAISENITVMIRNMEQTGSISATGSGSGVFMWPIRGEITSPYGWRTHPVFGDARFHSGIDIAADYDDPIVAADSGTIIYAGWMGGYGNAVMIDHGGGLVTLYGHNNSLTVSEGQKVVKGQQIAYAGSTGYSTGPHCHFEVRLHGEVVDPNPYLP